MGESFTSDYGKWIITVWMTNKVGTWNFRASKGKIWQHGTVESWNRHQAVDEVKLLLDELVNEV